MTVPLRCRETGGWREKYVMVTSCLGPVLERLANLETFQEEEVAQVLPLIQKFVEHDAQENFNRSLIHGAIFGVWSEVQKELEHCNVFVPLFRCTITTHVYEALVRLGGFQSEMMECLYWMPKTSTALANLVSTLSQVNPKMLTSALELENGDREAAPSPPHDTFLLERMSRRIFDCGEASERMSDMGNDIDENVNKENGPQRTKSESKEGYECWPPLVGRFLGQCMARMMPDHPCGLRSVFPSAEVHHQLSSRGVWTPPHLAVQMLTLLVQCPLNNEDVASDALFRDILPVCIEILGGVENDADQGWVIESVVQLEGYEDLSSRLSSDSYWVGVCRQAITPLLNQVMEMGTIEDGVVVDFAEEVERQHRMFSRFLPYVVLFPWRASEQLLKAALTSPGQLNIIHQMLSGWKGILTPKHPSRADSILMSAFRCVVDSSQAFLGTDGGLEGFAALTQKLVGKSGGCIDRMGLLNDVLVPCLEQYVNGKDVPVNAILLAVGGIVGGRYLTGAKKDRAEEKGVSGGVVRLVVALSKLLEFRPRALAWGQPIPCFAPFAIVELSEGVLESALEEIVMGKGHLSEGDWGYLMPMFSEVGWWNRVKVVGGLGGCGDMAGKLEGSGGLLPTSLRENYHFGQDPYQWSQTIEDCLTFIASSDSHCDKFVNHYGGVAPLPSECLEQCGVDDLAKDLANAAGECPPHLLPWCLVTSFARMLPFLTYNETARLCLRGLVAFLSTDPLPCNRTGVDLSCAGDSTLLERVDTVCGVVELMCRAIYFLTAHEDVLLVDRSEAIALALVKVIEVCEGFRQMFEGDAVGMELLCGRCLREICGLMAAIQYHHSCAALQPMILQLLQSIVGGCRISPDEEESIAVTAVGVPLRVTIEWLCGMVGRFENPMKNVVLLALDRMVQRKLAEIGVKATKQGG
ncbi:hypothetical protein BSKO_06929 [Bryopsis sp. KO-2023]|nr:hypothetical protein BSKO_06929 [Bryopsis sp. KO-2023]